MRTKVLAASLGLLAALPPAALPCAAGAEQLLPPGNSAANQYTEAYPTSGGDASVRGAQPRSPAKALGAKNARRLERLGPEGRAAADLAAATAPAGRTGGTPSQRDGGGAMGGGTEPDGELDPAGSSGLAQVLGEATGASADGELGPLLPLIVIATVVSAVAYVWRRRRTA